MLEIPPLPENTILLVEVGSTAHGTGLPGGEDHDEMGVVIEAPEDVLGVDLHGYRSVMQRSRPEGTRSRPGDTDRTLLSLRRFIRLAASGNPSILMSLWAPVLYTTEEGRELQGLGAAFVGRHVIPRYLGYMQAQTMRLLGLRGDGHAPRGGGGREEPIGEHGYDTKYAMHAARLGFHGVELLTTRRLQLPMPDAAAEWLRAVRRGEVTFDNWRERYLALYAQLERMSTDESIPEGPDRARIESWSVRAHVDLWVKRRAP